MAAMIHLAATIPELTLASDTHYPWLVESADIIERPRLTIRDGAMAVPTGPGLGIALDPTSWPAPTKSTRNAGCAAATTARSCDGSSRAGRARRYRMRPVIHRYIHYRARR